MLSVDRQASGHVIGPMISVEIFSKVCAINFAQRADNFFWCRAIVSYDQISNEDDR